MLLFVALAFGLLAVHLVVSAIRPLVESGVVTADDWARIEDNSAELLNRRDRLIAELREIEFEAALHKIDARDLQALRARYEAEALEVVRRLDERAEGYESRIDADVTDTLDAAEVRREQKATPPTPDEAPTCGSCGAQNRSGARFCDGCGQGLSP